MNEYTDEQLQAELERRKKPSLAPPDRARYPDWEPLIKTIEDGTARSIKDGYEDDDFKHYVYESAMIAVYGKDYFVWRNAQKWG